MSQVYPASVPIEVFMDDAVALFNEGLQRRGNAGLDSELAYEFHRVNGTSLDVTKSLDELGIEDGATLVLVPTREGDPFEPHYESLSTGLARVGKSLFAQVTAEFAVRTALTIMAMLASTMAGLSTYARMTSDSIIPTVTLGTAGLTLLCCAGAVLRWWPERMELFRGFGWSSIPLISTALAWMGPGPLAAPHAFIAMVASVVLVWSVVAISGQNRTSGATAITIGVIGGGVAGLRMWDAIPAQILGIGALLSLVFGLTIAPTISLWAARIRPPHFGSITGRDLFRRGDGLPVDTVSPVDDDAVDESVHGGSHSDITPSGGDIAAVAQRANWVLSGICMGLSLTFPVAVWFVVAPGTQRGTGAAVLVGLFVVILVSRARTFADRRQAGALVLGAVAGVCSAVVRYVLSTSASAVSALPWAAAMLGCCALVATVAALVVPRTRFTPMMRMLAEWVELAAIVAVFPLAAWIGGLFTWIRMR